eukprot:351952-Chlamydomonas_euryale.AAC.7
MQKALQLPGGPGSMQRSQKLAEGCEACRDAQKHAKGLEACEGLRCMQECPADHQEGPGACRGSRGMQRGSMHAGMPCSTPRGALTVTTLRPSGWPRKRCHALPCALGWSAALGIWPGHSYASGAAGHAEAAVMCEQGVRWRASKRRKECAVRGRAASRERVAWAGLRKKASREGRMSG